MDTSIVFMFSGQGSQYYHMGKELFKHHPVFRKWMFMLDDVISEITGESVLSHLYDKKRKISEPFDRLIYSYPAMFMVEYSLAQALLESGIEPEYVLGTSMGEFASAALADVMNVEELVKVLLKQAECLETSCNAGGMLSIMHDVTLFSEVPLIRENSDLAAVNYGTHFVISGEKNRLSEIEQYLKNSNILYQSLPIVYGFHSSHIDSAAMACKKYLQQISFQNPRFSFISCMHGTFLDDISGDYLWDVVRMPVQFPKAIRELENGRECIYLDLGPSGTLANFAKRNLTDDSKSESYAIMTPFNQELKKLEMIKRLFPAKTCFLRKVGNKI